MINSFETEYMPMPYRTHCFPFSLNISDTTSLGILNTKASIPQALPCVTHRGSFIYLSGFLQCIKITCVRKCFVGTGPIRLDVNYLRD